jgi:DNA-binding NtrC family response regulator
LNQIERERESQFRENAMQKILLSEIVKRRDYRLNEFLVESRQFEIALFDTPYQAIQILENDKKIDLVMVAPEDIQNAKTDLLGYLKTSARLSWIPIILIGKNMDVDFVNYCLDCGISDILCDPVIEESLLKRLTLAVNNGRRRILIVDDDDIVLKVLTTSLEMERYVVFAAQNAEDALRIFKKQAIHGVITDIKLKNIDGLGLLTKIKERSPFTPVVIITGHSGICTSRDAIAAGADGYFTKPFNNMELVYTLRRIFGFKSFYVPGRYPESVSIESS